MPSSTKPEIQVVILRKNFNCSYYKICTHTPNTLTFIPSNLDKARRGLSALRVLRDFRALPEEQSDDVASETGFSAQETNDSCVH